MKSAFRFADRGLQPLDLYNRLVSIRDGQSVTLAMIDMNRLKAINDSYGHKAGEQEIIRVSQTLLSIPVRGKNSTAMEEMSSL